MHVIKPTRSHCMLHIVADQAIPHVADYFSELGTVQRLPAKQIHADTVKHADILLVRSVTAVNHALLAHSTVRWVGTMTAGMDHIDQDALHQMGIAFAHAPGCNASAVAEYTLACIAACSEADTFQQARCAGIIGYGHAGQHVARLYRALGWQVIAYDPPKALREPSFESAVLSDLSACDVLSVHASLHDEPPYSSRGLINKDVLSLLKPGCIFINASRGDVSVEQDLLCHGQHLKLCLDVWHDEPNIDPELIAATTIATPHIAGHSSQAKHRATQKIYQLCRTAFNLDTNAPHDLQKKMATTAIDAGDTNQADWPAWIKQVYDPTLESHALQMAAKGPAIQITKTFMHLRAQHQRHGFSSYTIQSISPTARTLARALGFGNEPATT